MASNSSRSRSRSVSRGGDRRSRSRDHKRRSRSNSRGRHGAGYKRRSYTRSRSKSPLSDRKRHVGSRDAPEPSKCLGIFGLSTRTTEADLRDVFDRYPGFVDSKIITDYGTGISRGFAFLTFESTDDARYVKDKCVGMDIDGRSIRIDFSTTTRPHTPTPGRYMGLPSHRPRPYRGGGGRGGRRYDDYGGGSRYYSRRRYSRSYSRSPRRY